MKAAAEMFSRGEAASLLVGGVILALAVYFYQNRSGRIGGSISAIKAAWLAYAIVLWIVLPVILWREGTAFVVLAISMGVRVIVEVPLCLIGRWRVVYGVLHDLFHAAAVITVMCCWDLPGLEVWGVLTLVCLVSELLFVRWFVKATGGPSEGVYFVPGGEGFRAINYATAMIFIPQAISFSALLLLAMKQNSPVI